MAKSSTKSNLHKGKSPTFRNPYLIDLLVYRLKREVGVYGFEESLGESHFQAISNEIKGWTPDRVKQFITKSQSDVELGIRYSATPPNLDKYCCVIGEGSWKTFSKNEETNADKFDFKKSKQSFKTTTEARECYLRFYKNRKEKIEKLILAQFKEDESEEIIEKAPAQKQLTTESQGNEPKPKRKPAQLPTDNFNITIPPLFNDKFYEEDNSQLIPNLIEKINQNKIVFIYGAPGQGKSFLARKLALTMKDQYDIVWILNTDDQNTIENSLEKITDYLLGEDEFENIIKYKGKQAIIPALKTYLADKSWLLIYDNAGDSIDLISKNEKGLNIFDFVNEYFPDNNTNSDAQKIIIVSRNGDWDKLKTISTKYFKHTIEYWDVSKVKSFLQKGVDIIIDDDDQLKSLEGLPLIAAIAKEFLINESIENGDLFPKFSSFYDKWKEEKKKRKLLDDTKAAPHYQRDEYYLAKVSLFSTIKITYNILPENLQSLLEVVACFAPNDLPYTDFYVGDNITFINQWLNVSNETDFIKLIKRLVRFSLFKDNLNAFSMHNFIQECVLMIEENPEKENANYFKAIKLLSNIASKWGLSALPHADHLFKNFTLIIDNMSIEDEEKNQAAKLFAQSGQLHSQQGHNKVAEEHFRKGLEIVKDEAIEADLQKKLAKILFLKGKRENGINEALELSKKVLTYYENQNDWDNIIYCYNELQSKIYQRLCQFQESENALNKASELIKKHKPNYTKYSTLYHDYGSLYWTWGRKGDNIQKSDYIISTEWFEKAIAAADNDFSKAISRMISGAVLGLQKIFDQQEANHRWAFDIFKAQDEERRYTYTSYYQLSYGWDKEKLTGKLPTDFNQSELLAAVRKYQFTQSTDEKCNVIYKIIHLRVAVRDNDAKVALEAHSELWQQLEDMKYGERYYDIDTCSVSAFLDYAQFLKEKYDLFKQDQYKKDAITVTEQALAVIKNIEYHRMAELNQLTINLGI